MSQRTLRLRAAAVVLLLTASGLATAAPASAAACNNSSLRFASSSNRLYVTSGIQTPSSIKALCPDVPLVLVDAERKIWELRSDLYVENGATLKLHGSGNGGDTDQLRLLSRASNAWTEVVQVTAQYGTIDMSHTRITSWDPAVNGPDVEPELPAGAATTDRGRAFVRAVSYLDGGVARESRMTIESSDLGYLGYYAAEAYGVSYKARGCTVADPASCELVDVFGFQRNSRFHHNYFGTYTWGAEGMDFVGNEYDHNKMYGLDPHDDSDHLLIDRNSFHDNGNHGLICSQRCDDLTITNNVSHSNGLVPFAGPKDEDPSDNQVHGIMIHRGVTDTVIANNHVYNHPTGAGIAVFESFDSVIENNLVEDGKYGLRFSVGSHDVISRGNTINRSSQYAVYTYKGSDPAQYGPPSGRPYKLTFANNRVTGTGSDLFKVTDSDDVVLRDNVVSGPVGAVRLDRSTGTQLVDNTLPASQPFKVTGTAAVPGSATVRYTTASPRPVKSSVDANSRLSLVNGDGRLYELSTPVDSTVSSDGSSTVTLTSALVGTATVTATPRPAKAVPGTGTAKARPKGFSSTTARYLYVAVPTAGRSVRWSVGGWTPGNRYVVRVNGARIGTLTADADGYVTSTVSPSSTAQVEIKVSTT